ncbi:glycerophosphoryl diester phosphodiesterase [Vibrio sp. MACH09]|uniref:glycerophosphodiester phosphodiesterase family protein n=1 Tax=unclassified Vibrio TaxID=2614977 RepID=UPI00149376E1|nr:MULTISPECIES: glycerophosphodiester phosphodiesterase family protein [unclassified Vibrio]NOI64960.1 glycerophosphoryl diester phosphodiesterase [Vibrio sp. 99-8-1]GLO62634.1 glycerophosphoryl diester phosphodiesterase [Vibrio sp. MACH09]
MTTKIVGHRGFSGCYPENTRLSILKAVELGLNWVEIDIQPTEDGELVVCHDFTVDRCSNGTGRVDSLTLDQIRQLDFGQWFSSESANEQIMTIDELLALAKEHGLHLNIEVKLDTTNARKVVRTLKKALILSGISTDRVLLSSFSFAVLDELAKQCSAFRIGVISEEYSDEVQSQLQKVSAYSCHLNYQFVTQNQLDTLKQQGYQVWCYTVNRAEDFALLEQVDAIFSDFPDRF